MSEYNNHSIRTLNEVKSRPWLFPKHMPKKISLSGYINYFEKKAESYFCILPAMAHFSTAILDEFKDRVFWTGFISVNDSGQYALHTIVQVNPHYHIVMMYAQEEGEVSILATIYTDNPNDWIEFVEKHKDKIVAAKPGLGFLPGSSARG